MSDEQQLVQLVQLAEAADRFQRCSAMPELTSQVADSALAVLPADACSVTRLDRHLGKTRVLLNSGLRAAWEQEWPVDESYVVGDYPQVVETMGGRTPPWRGSVDDPGTDPADRDLLQRLGRRHGLAVHVRIAGRVWGSLYLTRVSDPPFDTDSETVATVLAGLVSSALSRLELVAELSRLAYSDALTGLANRRAADDWLHERLAAPEPFPSVGLLLCDINGMKSVNDQLGHPAGDELIRMVAAAVSNAAARLGDGMAARIGGDEFLLLCEGLPTDAVTAMAGELTRLSLPHGAGLAVGAAATRTRPAGGSSPEAAARTLLRLADAAQYRHKRTRQVAADAVSADSLPVSALLPGDAATVSDRVLTGLRALGSQRRADGVGERLAVVADVVTDVYGCAAWWVSRHRDSVYADVLGQVVRADSGRDLHQIARVSSTPFDPDDFPETARCLRGGSLFATLTTGHETERAFVASLGYLSELAAGEPDLHGHGWLLELYGDERTAPGLFTAEQLVRVLVHLAVTGATDLAPAG